MVNTAGSDVDSPFLWFNLLSGFCFMHLPCIFLPLSRISLTMKDHQWPHMFLSVSNRCNWSSGLEMRLWRKTRWMGVWVPLTQSSRRTGLNSRCCLGYHILAVIPLQCRYCLRACNMRGDREWEPPGTAKNDLRLFSIACCSGDFDQLFCAAGSFFNDTIFTVYRHLVLFSMNVRLHLAHMFIDIISCLSAVGLCLYPINLAVFGFLSMPTLL